MGEASSNSDPTLPPDSGESEATRVGVSREPPTQPQPIVQPPYQPTYVPPRPPATEPPQQQIPDAAPRQPEANAPREPATIVTPRLPPAGVVPPEQVTQAPAPEPPATHAPPPEPAATHAPPPEPTATYARPPEPPVAAAPPPPPASEVVRYGPGIPASQAGAAAESVWRTGHQPEPPPRPQGWRRLWRVLGMALTVILLVTAGVVLYLRFFDHPAFQVTGVKIMRQTGTACTVDVTGRIDTNGAAGTVSYQWVFRPQTGAPQPLSQSVVAGQHAVFVTVAVEGQGHGTGSRLVTLDILSPGTDSASTMVTVSC